MKAVEKNVSANTLLQENEQIEIGAAAAHRLVTFIYESEATQFLTGKEIQRICNIVGKVYGEGLGETTVMGHKFRHLLRLLKREPK